MLWRGRAPFSAKGSAPLASASPARAKARPPASTPRRESSCASLFERFTQALFILLPLKLGLLPNKLDKLPKGFVRYRPYAIGHAKGSLLAFRLDGDDGF